MFGRRACRGMSRHVEGVCLYSVFTHSPAGGVERGGGGYLGVDGNGVHLMDSVYSNAWMCVDDLVNACACLPGMAAIA